MVVVYDEPLQINYFRKIHLTSEPFWMAIIKQLVSTWICISWMMYLLKLLLEIRAVNSDEIKTHKHADFNDQLSMTTWHRIFEPVLNWSFQTIHYRKHTTVSNIMRCAFDRRSHNKFITIWITKHCFNLKSHTAPWTVLAAISYYCNNTSIYWRFFFYFRLIYLINMTSSICRLCFIVKMLLRQIVFQSNERKSV